MKTMIKILLSLGVYLLLTVNLYAADISEGEKKAKECIVCHGLKGISKEATYPNLAGQQTAYLVAQLQAFKQGTRIDPMMQPLAKQLSLADMNNLAAYFASITNKTAHHPDSIKVTEETRSKAIMCTGCHGRKAEGRGTFPKLTHQHVLYLAKQLNDFKSGYRNGGPMSGIAKSLSDDDIQKLSHYFSNFNTLQ
jgi:cytochrome c553